MNRDRIFDILTLLMLGMTLIIILVYVAIAINPYLPLNPFPPVQITPVTLVATDTPTPTPGPEDVPTWTPTTTPTITPTPLPTFTPTVTPTPTEMPPTETPTPTPTITPRVTRSPYPFTYEINYDTPYYGCNWTGVAGIVQDLDGNNLQGYPIHIWGGGIDVVVNSGDKQMYGDSGWEQFFNSAPMESRGTFRVQIHSQYEPHAPVSEEIVLNFEGYCSTAMAYIVFTKNH